MKNYPELKNEGKIFHKGFLTVKEGVFNEVVNELKDDEEILVITVGEFGDAVFLTDKRILFRPNGGLGSTIHTDINFSEIDKNSIGDSPGAAKSLGFGPWIFFIANVKSYKFRSKLVNPDKPTIFKMRTKKGFPLLETMKSTTSECKIKTPSFDKKPDNEKHVFSKNKLLTKDVELDLSSIPKKTYTLPDKHFNYIRDQFLPDEKIDFSLRGAIGTDKRGSKNGSKSSGGFFETEKVMLGHSWIILTNKRILMSTMGVFTADTRDFLYENISSIDYEKGFLTDRLTIHSMSSVEDIEFMADVVEISRKLPAMIRSRMKNHLVGKKATSSSEEPLNILKVRLAKGEITKEEFEDLKKSLLD